MRLVRDGLVNYAGYASASLAGMVLVPILLRGLTPELYGLWIAATALEYSASCLTGGLGRAVAREVAGAGVDGRKHETQRFVAAAASGYILFALLGALLIGLLGFPLSSGLRLSRESREAAPYVFGLAGIAFFGDQLLAFAAEVLTGKRRFATLNLVTGSGVLVRTVGIVVLLSKGSSLLPVAAWHSLVSVSLAAAAMLLVARMEPGYLPRPWNVQWTAFHSQTRFCVSTQATAGFTSLLWRSAPFLIGMRLGSAAIVPFEIGQKLSLVLFAMSWQVAEVVYPAASEYHYAQERIRARQLLLVGTRGIALLTLPICILLWILAPHLLQVWLGTAHADSVPVLRLTTLAVFADTAAAIAVQILYGRGAVGTVLKLTAAAALANIGLTLALLGGLGVTAGGWGLCLTVPAVAFLYLKTAARSCEITVSELLQFAAGGLVVPSVACAATAGGFAHWAPPSNWMTLVIAATSALAAYGVVAGFTFAASQSGGQLSRGAYSVCRRLRKALERVPGLRGPIRFRRRAEGV